MRIIKYICKNKKRITAFVLIIIMVIPYFFDKNLKEMFGFLRAEAASERVSQSLGNLLDGNAFNFYGKDGRTSIFYWKASNGTPAFCLDPTKSMSSGNQSTVEQKEVTDDWSLGLTWEEQELIYYAMAASGCGVGNKNVSVGGYIMVQSAIWAITSGEWSGADDFKANMEIIIARLKPAYASVGSEIRSIVDSFANTVNAFSGNQNEYIPVFANKFPLGGKTVIMTEDSNNPGVFKSKAYEWKSPASDFVFNLPEVGWSVLVENDNITFICDVNKGGVVEQNLITGIPKAGSILNHLVYPGEVSLFIPSSSGIQPMINQVKAAPWVCYAQFERGTPPIELSYEEGYFELEAHRYEHEESWKTNYKIELEKKDDETGQLLKNATFSILEAFNQSQLNGTNLEKSQFSKESSTLKEHVRVITDENGYASHGDVKSYSYEKTYCYGHPEPVIYPAENIDGDGATEEEQAAIDAANAEIDALNEQLEIDAKAAWDAEVASCEAETDFHSIEIGEGEEMLQDDRDEAWSTFINLKYRYGIKEVNARNGYILHDYHTDDIPIEVVEFKSSQAGGTGTKIGTLYKGVFTSGMSGVTFSDTADSEDGITISPFGSSGTGWDGIYEESEVSNINQSSYNKNKIAYTFKVTDHRTEGEVHINKRDLELYNNDTSVGTKGSYTVEDSYGKTQADATLEGAVYGLYAAEDIVHPDGKSRVVFKANELVAEATTDKNGDASFVCITEESETSKNVPNLYDGSSLNGKTYPDYKTVNGGGWIGRPLLLGSYYIKEITRSEGYELSQYGINLSESNRQADTVTIKPSVSTSVSSLTHPINEWDGSWNEFTASYLNTVNGYDLVISGYPEGSKFYRVDTTTATKTVDIVIDKQEVVKQDEHGQIIYQTAAGGEYKYDSSGNHIPKTDEHGEIVYDASATLKSSVAVLAPVMVSGVRGFTSLDNTSYPDMVDESFVMDEIEEALSQMRYRNVSGKAPYYRILLSGEPGDGTTTNEDWIDEILLGISEFTDAYPVFDSIRLESIESVTIGTGSETGEEYYAVIRYAYTLISSYTNLYDGDTGIVALKQTVEYADGTTGFGYVVLDTSEYAKTGNRIVIDKFEVIEPADRYSFLESSVVYDVEYERYEAGELLLDDEGNPIPETETVYIYGTEEIEEITETLVELTNVTYNSADGTYRIHVENTINWDSITVAQEAVYRATAPDIEFDGMSYADYILQIANGSVSVFANNIIDEGSYVQPVFLLYPGQLIPYQDAGTRKNPITVLERVIKQPIKIVKDISLSSYDLVNTYAIHKDPFTVLFGGWNGGRPSKAFLGFSFKVYLVSDLMKTGELETKADGTYNYEKFFGNKENQELFNTLAIEWDKPGQDSDGDLTTLHANIKGNEQYYGASIALPYGTYVVVEQQPTEFVNKHYKIDDPKEVIIPFVPQIENGTVYDVPAIRYFYDSAMTPEELAENYLIRFNEETHVIHAHNRDGDYEVYKYGLVKERKPVPYGNPVVAKYYRYNSTSEHSGTKNKVYYEAYVDRNGNTIDYGVTLDGVKTMTGATTAIDRLYAPALVPWSVLEPKHGEVINDNGDIGNRDPELDNAGKFNFVAYAVKGFENTFFHSKLRIEKIDSETGENIIHDGAYFKIYAASRDVTGVGTTGVEGTGDVLFDADGVPVYDESEQIFMKDIMGAETGIFKAYSTLKEVITANGVEKKPVGYIETYQPLGAGVYVLVEVTAPKGYVKSKPVAFEVYSDKVTYYYNGNQGDKRTAKQYQYAIPFTETTQIVSRIVIEDNPSHIAIHKVEDGIETVTFEVRGSKAFLEARGDVTGITYDPVTKEWYGTVTKAYDEWSEHTVYGTEEELKQIENVKLLYDTAGNYLGTGIRFDISVKDATLTLYEGLLVTKTGTSVYDGVTVEYKSGKVSRITASETGTHTEIKVTGTDGTVSQNFVWDTVEVDNRLVEILFYDLDNTDTERDAETGILYILDERGNRTCMADSATGMAYVLDDYENIIVYPVDKEGNKIKNQSIKIHRAADGTETIYTDIVTVDDENGLPVYYKDGHVTLIDDIWVTDGEKHPIVRLPFGAYILEETITPYSQGYIRTKPIGLILKETDEEQKFFLEDDFTKVEISKVDITSKEEIQDARMTLYYADMEEDSAEKGYHLEYAKDSTGNKRIRTSWISGYEYDDNGKLKLNEQGEKIPTTKPHWIDHLPVGYYILEEVLAPYEQGYVKSSSIEVEVLETGEVQGFVMEDDYTSIEVIKTDINTGEILPGATLGLYKAKLNADGTPVLDSNEIPQIDVDADTGADNNGLILTWETEDGKDIAATAYPKKDEITGEQLFDKYGQPMFSYDYEFKDLDITLQARYYITETGALHIDYLPVGYYILVEEEAPKGYEKAESMLVQVKDIGGETRIQTWNMEDYPLTTVDIEKVIAGNTQKLLVGASLQLTDSEGNVIETWTSTGKKKRFTALDPGEYTLTELQAPSGYQKAEPITFLVATPAEATATEATPVEIQRVIMEDEVIPSKPGGGSDKDTPVSTSITKEDAATGEKLKGAWIVICNPDGSIYAKGQTGSNGRFYFKIPPKGTYTFQELSPPEGYFQNETIFTFTVDKDGTITGDNTIRDVKKQTVILTKADVTDAKELPGATIEIYDQDGNTVFYGISDENGKVYFEPFKPGVYTFKETIAPEGYKLNETVFTFTILENGRIIGDNTIYDEPEIIEIFDNGVPMAPNIPTPNTGDDNLLAICIGVSLLAISIAIILVFKTKKEDKNNVKDYFR